MNYSRTLLLALGTVAILTALPSLAQLKPPAPWPGILEREVTQIYIKRGGSNTQLIELIRQLEIQAFVDFGDLGSGDDTEGVYRWDEFSVRKGTVAEMLEEFFDMRPEFRWHKWTNKTIWIEPTNPSKRLGNLVRKRFLKPVRASPGKEHFKLPSYKVEEAWIRNSRGRKRTKPERNLTGERADTGLILEVPLEATANHAFVVWSLHDFLRQWIHSQPCTFASIRRWNQPSLQGADRTGPNAYLEVALASWNPRSRKAPLFEIIAGFRAHAQRPPGYVSSAARVFDCEREISRRYHFDKAHLLKAFQASDIFAKSYSPVSLFQFLLNLDAPSWGPLLVQKFTEMSVDLQVKLLELGGLPTPHSHGERFFSFWEKLCISDIKALREPARQRLKLYRKIVEDRKNPKVLLELEAQVKGQDEIDAEGALYELQEIKTARAAMAISTFVFSKRWTPSEGPEMMATALRDIPRGREIVMVNLVKKLERSDELTSVRIHLTLLKLAGLKEASEVSKNNPIQIRAFWRKWKKGFE